MARWEEHDAKAVPAMGDEKITALSEQRRRRSAA
jgi:hypothetical protein